MPDDIKETIYAMKVKAEELKAYLDPVKSREMSIAQTQLEDAIMWATKAWVNVGDGINERESLKDK